MTIDSTISYYKAFKLFAKERWFKKQLVSTFAAEFNKPPSYFIQALKTGAIKINNQKVDPAYILKPKDHITHVVHVHEPSPIPLSAIQILHSDRDFIIVNKPHGIACHHTTNYFYYSLTKILEPKYGRMACVNRLDVPTSGVLVLTKGNKYHDEMRNRKIEKVYVAKVKGNLRDQEINTPLKQTRGSYTFTDSSGKKSSTVFRNIGYKNGYSLVECRPLTGRTHQIRVHLKSIGHPIVGDILYNEECTSSYVEVDYKCTGTVTITSDDDILETPDGECMEFAIEHCEGLNNRVFQNKDAFLCLHAYHYIIDGRVYTAPLPEWACLD